MTNTKVCPLCEAESMKVIYYGFPMHLCMECNCLFGFWEIFTRYMPFNGIFFAYEGSYFIALFKWIKG